QFLRGPNLGLITSRTVLGTMKWQDILVTDSVTEFGVMATRIGNGAPIMPLYVWHDDGSRTANFSPAALGTLTAHLKDDFEPEDILDYIYGVLHSAAYRARYEE